MKIKNYSILLLFVIAVSCTGSLQTNINGKWKIIKFDCTNGVRESQGLCMDYYKSNIGTIVEFKTSARAGTDRDSVKWHEGKRFHPCKIDETDSLIVLSKENIKILKLTATELTIHETEKNSILTTYFVRAE